MSNHSGPKPEQTPNGYIVLGTIVRPHGLKGEVKISLSCSGLDRLVHCPSLRILKDGKEYKKVSVIRSFMHQDGDAVVRFKEIVGPDEAESLRGAYVTVLESERATLPEGAYYQDDLVGLAVVKSSGEELGKVEEIMDGLANAVLVVRQGNVEVLVPMLKSVVREVDLQNRRIVVDLMEEIDADAQD